VTVVPGPWKNRPGRHDDANAERWRGDLFGEGSRFPHLMWKQDGAYHLIDPPKSVTFPICTLCGHVVWEWPHYEEPVPDNAVCERCFIEESAA